MLIDCHLNFIPPELPDLLNKNLSLLAACMYYDADLLSGHRIGLFWGQKSGKDEYEVRLF